MLGTRNTQGTFVNLRALDM